MASAARIASRQPWNVDQGRVATTDPREFDGVSKAMPPRKSSYLGRAGPCQGRVPIPTSGRGGSLAARPGKSHTGFERSFVHTTTVAGRARRLPGSGPTGVRSAIEAGDATWCKAGSWTPSVVDAANEASSRSQRLETLHDAPACECIELTQ